MPRHSSVSSHLTAGNVGAVINQPSGARVTQDPGGGYGGSATIMFAGDSITTNDLGAGTSARELIHARLDISQPTVDHEYVGEFGTAPDEHLATAGLKIAGLISHVSAYFDSYRPNVMVLIIGTNNLPAADYDGVATPALLGDLLDDILAKKSDCQIVVCSPPTSDPDDLTGPTTTLRVNAADFAPKVGIEAAARGLIFVDLHADSLAWVTADYEDHVHLTATGNVKLADAIQAGIESAVVASFALTGATFPTGAVFALEARAGVTESSGLVSAVAQQHGATGATATAAGSNRPIYNAAGGIADGPTLGFGGVDGGTLNPDSLLTLGDLTASAGDVTIAFLVDPFGAPSNQEWLMGNASLHGPLFLRSNTLFRPHWYDGAYSHATTYPETDGPQLIIYEVSGTALNIYKGRLLIQSFTITPRALTAMALGNVPAGGFGFDGALEFAYAWAGLVSIPTLCDYVQDNYRNAAP